MKKFFGIVLTASMLISSCNMPSNTKVDAGVATSAALTVQAVINSTPVAVSAASNTPALTTPSATYSKPMITVGDVTNCRTGPGTNYEKITQILPNEQVEVIGAFQPSFWVVKTNSGICWVNREFATPIGSIQAVPTVTAPPTPTGKAPEGVSLQKWDIFCNFQTGNADVTIKWSDKSNDETGYRVIRDGNLIVELPANTTSYSETIPLVTGQSASYSVTVFNAIGSESSSTITLTC
ncbi:MAG: SH3 domain-containing protein [Anaerolineales bacterium]